MIPERCMDYEMEGVKLKAVKEMWKEILVSEDLRSLVKGKQTDSFLSG